MLLMVEKGIRGGICHATYRYAKDLDDNNLSGWGMSQKLPVGGFKWKKNTSKFTKEFMKKYDEDNNKSYILEVDVKYPKNLHGLHENLPFLLETMKIGKCKKRVCKIIKTSLKSCTNDIKKGS